METLLGLMAAAPASTQNGPSPLMMPMMLVFMFALMYFMILRPQRRREKERQALISAIKTGDRVMFSGGIIGVVSNVKDKTLVVKIADKTKIEVLRGAVSQVLSKDDLPDALELETPQAQLK